MPLFVSSNRSVFLLKTHHFLVILYKPLTKLKCCKEKPCHWSNQIWLSNPNTYWQRRFPQGSLCVLASPPGIWHPRLPGSIPSPGKSRPSLSGKAEASVCFHLKTERKLSSSVFNLKTSSATAAKRRKQSVSLVLRVSDAKELQSALGRGIKESNRCLIWKRQRDILIPGFP